MVGKRWTAFFSATVSVAFLVGLSVALFGWEPWRSFLERVVESGTYSPARFQLIGSITLFSAAVLLGLPTALAYFVQAMALLAGVILVSWIWWHNASLPVRSAALVAGTLFAVPYALLYEMTLAVVAIAWLVRAGNDNGFLFGEKAILGCIYIIPLVAVVAAIELRLPLGPYAPAALMILCMNRGRHEMRGTKSAQL
jgi:hypothetical protein